MSLKIAPISDIFDLSNLPKVVKDNMKKALLGYCNWLATAQNNRTIITTCSAPKSNNVTLETKKFFKILYTSPTKGCVNIYATNFDTKHSWFNTDLTLEQCKQLCSTDDYCRAIDFINKPNKWGKTGCSLSTETKWSITPRRSWQSPCKGDYADSVHLEKKSLHILYTSKVIGCLAKPADWIYYGIETMEQCKYLCSTFWDCRSVDFLPTKTSELKWQKVCYLHKHTRLTMPQKFKEPCNDHWWSMEHVEKQI